MTLVDLIPDSDYRFHIRLEPIEIDQFFAPTNRAEHLIEQRRHWLSTAPNTHAALLSDGAALLTETHELLNRALCTAPTAQPPTQTHWERCLDLGRRLEPDFLLLKLGTDAEIRLWGGCVCFPTSWSLAEKIGHPIEFIHDVVPGLNGQIGPQIHTFLTRLKPGLAWTRTNWGLSASAELNQHPERRLPRIHESTSLDQIWFRVEHQALVALPRTGGILFGIRISMHPFSALKAEPIAARRLARALRTMPEAVARYKGLQLARAHLIALLETPIT